MLASQCFYGIFPHGAQPVLQGQCGSVCRGDNTELCGGSSTLSLFSKQADVSEIESVLGYKYSACYTDADERTLRGRSFAGQPTLTASSFARLCGSYLRYFGVENGNECWCGNSLDSSRVADPASCNVPCW